MNKQEFAEKIKDILIQRLGSSYRILIQQLDHLNQPEMELLNDVFEYEKAKAHLFLRVVNTDRNRKLLENIPSVECLDMSVVFCLLLIKYPEQVGSVTITNAMVEGWNVSKEELYQDALINGQKLFPLQIMELKDIIPKLLTDGSDIETGDLKEINGEEYWKSSMTVVSNEVGVNGAGAMLYPDVLDNQRERLGGDFYILPSSIHEVIVIPADESIIVEELKEMVLEVNETMVSEAEQLSGHVYFYSDGKLKLAA